MLILSQTILSWSIGGDKGVFSWMRRRNLVTAKIPYPSARYDVIRDPRTGPAHSALRLRSGSLRTRQKAPASFEFTVPSHAIMNGLEMVSITSISSVMNFFVADISSDSQGSREQKNSVALPQ